MKKVFHRKDMKEAFRAGTQYGMDLTMSYEDAMPVKEPHFDMWYEEYLKLKNEANRI